MAKNPLLLLEEHGQSVWLDNLTRDLVGKGGLKGLIEDDGLSGVTSNPAIFNKAMTKGSAYDDQIRELAEAGKPVGEIYEALAIRDIRDAADLLRPVYDRTNGIDGFVSLEVSPTSPGIPRAPSARRSACGRKWAGPTSSSRSPAPWKAFPPSAAPSPTGST